MPDADGYPDADVHGLRRVLGPFDATCVVVGAIIGVGIFFTPSNVVAIVGSGSLALVAWAIGGAIAMTGALTFAELGGMYPRTGGQYAALRDAYGPLPAFVFVTCNATAIQTGAIAIIALVCARHLGMAVAGAAPTGAGLLVVTVVLILAVAAANAAGVRLGSGIQNLTVVAKVATLALVTVLAALLAPQTPPAPPDPALAPSGPTVALLAAALVPALFSFGGWQHALWIAGEVRRPRRNVPLAIIGGVAVVVVAYLLVNWAYLELLGSARVAASPALAAEAVAVAWPGAGGRVVAAAVAISAFGVLNAQLLSGPRLLCGMAADGRFFRIFAGVDPRLHTPVPAIALLTGVALLLLFVAGERRVDRLLTGVVLVDAVFMALTGLAVPILRRRRPAADRPVRTLGFPIVPLLFVVGEVAVVTGAFLDEVRREAAWIGIAWIAAATLAYVIWFRARDAGS